MSIQRKGFWTTVTILIAILTMALVIKSSGMSMAQLRSALGEASLSWLIPAAFSMAGIIFFEGEAVLAILWRAGYPHSHKRGFVYAAADVYFSAITPSATGGQPASAFFMIRDGVPAAVATACLLLNLVMYNAAILTIGISCLILKPTIFLNYQPGSRLLIILGILVLTGLGIVFFLLLWKQQTLFRIAMKLMDLLHRMHLMHHPDKWKEKLLHAMHEYKDCVRLLAGSKKMWIQAYLFNVLQRVAQFSVSLFVFLSLGGEKGKLMDLWVTQCFVSLGSNCVPIPGSMGVTDYLMLDGYRNLMDREMTYTLQVISRGLSFYCCVLISGITVVAGYLLLKKRKTR